jgi:hypothetical protein
MRPYLSIQRVRSAFMLVSIDICSSIFLMPQQHKKLGNKRQQQQSCGQIMRSIKVTIWATSRTRSHQYLSILADQSQWFDDINRSRILFYFPMEFIFISSVLRSANRRHRQKLHYTRINFFG